MTLLLNVTAKNTRSRQKKKNTQHTNSKRQLVPAALRRLFVDSIVLCSTLTRQAAVRFIFFSFCRFGGANTSATVSERKFDTEMSAHVLQSMFEQQKVLLDHFFEHLDFAQVKLFADVVVRCKGLLFLTGERPALGRHLCS